MEHSAESMEQGGMEHSAGS